MSIDKRFFFRIIEEINILIILLNKDFQIEYFNKKAGIDFSLDKKDILETDIFKLPYEWCKNIRKQKEKLKSAITSDIYFKDIIIQKDNRTKSTIGLSIRKIKISNEDFFIITGQDVTTKRRKEAAGNLDENLKVIGEMASGIAHDLNSPLQTINNNLQFLKQANLIDYNINPEEINTVIDESLIGIKQISSLTKTLKNFIYPINSVIETLNIVQIIDDALSMSKSEWKKNTKIIKQTSEKYGKIRSYPAEITRVLLNLIINAAQAIKYSKIDNGTIQITAIEEINELRISVSDNGPGIPSDIRESIYQPFFTTKPKGIGSGQGLAISSSIIRDKCGGEISYQENIPSGSIFNLIIPDLGEKDE